MLAKAHPFSVCLFKITVFRDGGSKSKFYFRAVNCVIYLPKSIFTKRYPCVFHGGGGFFHSKGTWGCAAREGILFRPSGLAKGVLFGNFNRVKSRQGYAFWEFWSKRC